MNEGRKDKLLKFGELYRDMLQYCKRNHVILQMLLDDSLMNSNVSKQSSSASTNMQDQIKNQQIKITKSNTLPEMINVSSPTPKITTNYFINKEIVKSSKQQQQQQQQYKLDNVKYQEEIPESSLMVDLIFVLQGIEGKYIKFYQDIDAFSVDPSVNVPRCVRDLVGRICEFGWIFKQIRLFLTSPFSKNGLTNQSFCAAVKDEMTEFYRTIALLESEISSNTNNGPDENHIAMTLKGMFVWIQEPLQRLKFLASLISGVASLKGGQTMSYVHCFTSHGDAKIRKMLEDIVVRVSQPILAMIQRWIFEGEISDPYEEFFIAKFSSVPLEKTWREKYALRTTMIPAAIPLPMCRPTTTTRRRKDGPAQQQETAGYHDWTIQLYRACAGTQAIHVAWTR
ncbi:spindle pole body component 98 [Cavenderia fasciculata]|uniref:Spindle pole body component 98 n=1 Tax=Cavenderia fasciculata TaxID=261658 RepID=F4Q397_CACFS|nr:spindle pole body component 98 [Cavenderia fasciculata]EGG17607.1 spindle pole body component 98 [Cavenderia fasciculata]|eukprot:XP_004356091.1 spindle pole body component 98 [Cavenderia fasciculata]